MDVSPISARETRDQFLQLLVTQLQNQDPLEPMSQEDFLSQLAQFSTLEGVEKLNATIGDQLQLQQESLQFQQLSQAVSMVGHEVSYELADPGGLARIKIGAVDSISLDDSRIAVHIGSDVVDWSTIRSVAAIETPTPAPPPTSPDANLPEEVAPADDGTLAAGVRSIIDEIREVLPVV